LDLGKKQETGIDSSIV